MEERRAECTRLVASSLRSGFFFEVDMRVPDICEYVDDVKSRSIQRLDALIIVLPIIQFHLIVE
jgi:hypothetical protein